MHMVSIIIPIYNSEKFLSECIDSLVNQSYKETEIILVNDGSTDGSAQICEMYKSKYSNIVYYSGVNQGVSAARNIGIELALGEYVFFVDSDDIVPVDAIKKLMSDIDTNNADIAIGSFSYLRPKGIEEVVFDRMSAHGTEEIAQLIENFYFTSIVTSPCMKLYRKEIFKGCLFDMRMSLGEDLYFNMQVFRNCNKIDIIPDQVYMYRLENNESLSNSYKDNYYDGMKQIYAYAKTYFDAVEKECGTVLQRNNISYKWFVFAVAFSVRQVERRYSIQNRRKYWKNVCNDTLFVAMLHDINKLSFSERILRYFIRRKSINVLLLMSAGRALVRNMSG